MDMLAIFTLGGPMRLVDISTTKYPNTFTMVDDDDFENLTKWKWRAFKSSRGKSLYAHAAGPTKYMHRIIMGSKKGEQVDHIDGNGLNNQRHNLRPATCSQNQMNRLKRCDNTSGSVGVYFNKNSNKWYAQITINRKTKSLGHYKSIDDAIKARKKAVKKYYGEFANAS
jgi:HNH endonuclease/AP2 domain